MLKPGTVLSQRYRIQDVLGQGGMGAVYLAEAEALGGKKVAVKEMIPWGLPPHELDQAVAQFKKEASFLAYLEHPNLVPVTDFFVEDSKHYLVMAYIKGQTLLEKMMQRGRPFHWVEIAPWVDRLLDVLEYLHTQSILFRDLKPSNIMVSDDGRLHLIDFGIARSASQGQKTTTFLQGTGTRGFSPIEQYGDRLSTDQRSDIYALGATLYYLLSGSVPPDAVERVSRRKKIVPLSEKLRAAPPCLDGILQKAMALSSFDRYQNVAELRKALVALDPFTAFLPSQDSGVLPFGTRADLSQSVAEQTRVEPVRWRGLVQALGCFLLSGVLIFSFSAELSAADLTHSGQRSDSIASASQAGVSGREVASESKASARIPSTAASSKSTALLPTLNLAPTPEPDLAQQSSKKVEPIIAWESYPKAARVQRTIHAIQTETVSEPEEKQVEPSVAPKLRAVRTVTTQQTGPSGPVVQAPIYVMPPDGTVSGWESSTSSTTSSVYQTSTQWASRGQSVDPTQSAPAGGPSLTNSAVSSGQILGDSGPEASTQTVTDPSNDKRSGQEKKSSGKDSQKNTAQPKVDNNHKNDNGHKSGSTKSVAHHSGPDQTLSIDFGEARRASGSPGPPPAGGSKSPGGNRR